jgi:hypothetical protein
MGRVTTQALALVERFVDESHFALLQIAESTVNEFAALGRGTRGKVISLDKSSAQASGYGIEGDSNPGNTTANDDDVEFLGR